MKNHTKTTIQQDKRTKLYFIRKDDWNGHGRRETTYLCHNFVHGLVWLHDPSDWIDMKYQWATQKRCEELVKLAELQRIEKLHVYEKNRIPWEFKSGKDIKDVTRLIPHEERMSLIKNKKKLKSAMCAL